MDCNYFRWFYNFTTLIAILGLNYTPIPIGNASGQLFAGTYPNGQKWSCDFTFYTPPSSVDDVQIYSIGHRDVFSLKGSNLQYKIIKGNNAGNDGWTHDRNFWAFIKQKPGTDAYAVYHHATEGFRHRLTKGGTSADHGWIHDFTFWAYPKSLV